MLYAANKVMARDYEGHDIITLNANVYHATSSAQYPLNRDTVSHCEVVNAAHEKNPVSRVVRGFLGAAVIGPIGLLAATTAKTNSVYWVAITFSDGKRSLIEISGEIFSKLEVALFR